MPHAISRRMGHFYRMLHNDSQRFAHLMALLSEGSNPILLIIAKQRHQHIVRNEHRAVPGPLQAFLIQLKLGLFNSNVTIRDLKS